MEKDTSKRSLVSRIASRLGGKVGAGLLQMFRSTGAESVVRGKHAGGSKKRPRGWAAKARRKRHIAALSRLYNAKHGE